MAAKIIFAILATVASQINADVAQLVKDQKNLVTLPALPEDEGRSALGGGLYTQTQEFQCYCQYGYSMCVTNPYDPSEVRCLLSCYKEAFPFLNLNDYEWICSAVPLYRVPQVRRDNLDVPANNRYNGQQIPNYGPQAKTNSSYTGPVDSPYRAPVNVPYKAPVNAPYKAPVNAPYRAPVNSPYKVTVNAPYKGPVDGPYKGLVNEPYKGPVDGPYRGPVHEAYRGTVDGPSRAPVNVPYISPVDAPYGSPVDSSYRGANNS